MATDDASVSNESMTSHCNRSRDESTAVIITNEGDGQSNLVVTSTNESGNECEEDSISVELPSCSDSGSDGSRSCIQSVIGYQCDIGKLLAENVNFKTLPREQLYQILTHEPNPNSAVYPRTRVSPSNSFRQFQPTWLKKHPWLHYSQFTDGAFCHACAVFLTDNPGGQSCGQLVTKPFKAWVKQFCKFESHAKNQYHLTSLARMSEFIERYKHPEVAVDTQLNKRLQHQMECNQKVIESLFKIIIFCGKQGLAYRGHRDDLINFSDLEVESSHNEGNFIELVKFRAETDSNLHNHLQNAPKNAKYTSKTIQNQLIDIVAQQIRTEILSEVKEAKYYSVIADEVCDISNEEQFSICLHYVHDKAVKEMFLDFVEVERITGHVLATALLHCLSHWGLSYVDMRGQCYDGSTNMSSAKNGCKSIVQKHAPMATYTHCAAHRLNLAIVSACNIQIFKSTEACIGEISRFFKYSAKWQRLLEKCIDCLGTTPKVQKLKDSCRTWWVERIDSYTIFFELLPAVQKAMQAISSPNQFSELGTDWDWDGETLTKANGFLYQLKSSSFLISFTILLEVLATFRGLTMKLQMEAVDVMYAYKEVHETIKSLKDMRTDSSNEFHKIYMHALRIARSLHGDSFSFTQPRVVGRQIHRNNIQTSSVEDYYRISLYNDFISHVVSELQSRFTSNENQALDYSTCYLAIFAKQSQMYPILMCHRHYHQLLIFTRMIYHFMLCFLLSMGCGLENGRGLARKFHIK